MSGDFHNARQFRPYLAKRGISMSDFHQGPCTQSPYHRGTVAAPVTSARTVSLSCARRRPAVTSQKVASMRITLQHAVNYIAIAGAANGTGQGFQEGTRRSTSQPIPTSSKVASKTQTVIMVVATHNQPKSIANRRAVLASLGTPRSAGRHRDEL